MSLEKWQLSSKDELFQRALNNREIIETLKIDENKDDYYKPPPITNTNNEVLR